MVRASESPEPPRPASPAVAQSGPMLTRKQDELFSHAARLALRGLSAAKDGERPSSLKPLLENWGELEVIPKVAQGAARATAMRLLASASKQRPMASKGSFNNDQMRGFGLLCVMLFKIARGDDPNKDPRGFMAATDE